MPVLSNLKPIPRDLIPKGLDVDQLNAVYSWYNELLGKITDPGNIFWTQVDKTGSSIADIAAKGHNLLTGILPVDSASADTVKDKHVSNNDLKALVDNDVTHAAHIAATAAHGSTGNIVGTDNFATTTVGGTVKKSAAVADAGTSSVSVASANVSAAPAAYAQSWGVEVETLSNEMKGDINQLVTDVNAIKTTLNTLLANLRTSLVLTT